MLPPGQEAAIAALLGEGEVLATCTLESAHIAADAVAATWRCADGAVHGRLIHPDTAPADACVRGPDLAIVAAPNVGTAPPARRQALCAALTAHTASSAVRPRWARAERLRPATAAEIAAAAPARGSDIAAPAMATETAAAYLASDAHMRARDGRAILDLLLPVARNDPHPQLIARLVAGAAALAGADDGAEAVEALVAASAAAPRDDLLRLVAGVAVHYHGHLGATTPAAKAAAYGRAIGLLEPLQATMAHSPRLWIYLAISYHRTGRHGDAVAAIARAVAADQGADADVWYCRAEVLHQRDPAQALRDIDRYLATMAVHKQRGAWSAPTKEGRVQQMRHDIAEVVAGRRALIAVDDHSLFDPLPVQRNSGVPSAALALVGMALAIAAWAALTVAPRG